MTAAGRTTEDEAGRLRAARTSAEREDVARSIQLRHARARIDEAMEEGRLTKADAQAYLARLDGGEDLTFLRGIARRRGVR